MVNWKPVSRALTGGPGVGMAIRVQWISRCMPNLLFYRSQLVQRTLFYLIQFQTIAKRPKMCFLLSKYDFAWLLSLVVWWKENRPVRLRVWAKIPGIDRWVASKVAVWVQMCLGDHSRQFSERKSGLERHFPRSDSTPGVKSWVQWGQDWLRFLQACKCFSVFLSKPL